MRSDLQPLLQAFQLKSSTHSLQIASHEDDVLRGGLARDGRNHNTGSKTCRRLQPTACERLAWNSRAWCVMGTRRHDGALLAILNQVLLHSLVAWRE